MRKIKWNGYVYAVCASLMLSSVGVGSSVNVYGSSKKVIYQVTGENKKEKMVFENQPISSYWFPKDLLQWEAQKDSDLKYNISHIPLQKRAGKDALKTINTTQNKDTKVMAISIMNSSTSGNSPHGLNTAKCNTFTNYQYVDTLVYWGGSSGEGLIVPPSPDVTDQAHKNGVKVLGTVFFPQHAHGGKMEWLDDFLQEKNGTFLVVDKLIEVAKVYGFDGWFINQETEGTKENPLTKSHADKMQTLLKQLKEKAPELQIIYYDSMTKDGKMDWQNALTKENSSFLKTENNEKITDGMFLNFWWNTKKHMYKQLLERSKKMADEIGVDPYELYAGIDVQANGYHTPVRWNLFENEDGKTHTSLGIYCPSWTYFSSNSMEEFERKESDFWINREGDPSKSFVGNTSSIEENNWRGISTYVTEKTAITSLPFVTNFNIGSGTSFFKDGKKISNMDWNNRSIADVLPTYRYFIEQEGENHLQGYLDMEMAWYGGNSLEFSGKMEQQKKSVIHLYRTDFVIPKNPIYQTKIKSIEPITVNLILELKDGEKQRIKSNKKVSDKWETLSYDLSAYTGKTLRQISYEVIAEKNSEFVKLNLGQIIIDTKKKEKAGEVSELKIDSISYDEEKMYAGVRLTWKERKPAAYYEIYQVNENNTRSLLGVCNQNCFFIQGLSRPKTSDKTKLEVVPVTFYGTRGQGSITTMKWAKIPMPKADFTASKTLIKAGEQVTFESLCSKSAKEIVWEIEGANVNTKKGKKVVAKYEKAGSYTVTIYAKNETGTSKKEIKKCVVVKEDLPEQLTVLSDNCKASASSFVNENEAPQFAVDGDLTKKWCAVGSAPHTLVLNLQKKVIASEVEIHHAQAGGESADMNTKAYKIYVSQDGKKYQLVKEVTNNTKGVTVDTFAPTQIQYVKLVVEKPTQGADTATRIYEVKVKGIEVN